MEVSSFLFIYFYFLRKTLVCSGSLVKWKLGGSRLHLHYLRRQSILSQNYKFNLFQLFSVTSQEYFMFAALEDNNL